MGINSNGCSLFNMGQSESRRNGRTLQIIAFSEGQSYDGIRAGIRQLPVDKIVILHEETRDSLIESVQTPFGIFTKQLSDTLRIEIEDLKIESPDLNDVLNAVKSVLKDNEGTYTDFIMNVSAASKLLSCTAISSGFIFGIQTFYIDQGKVKKFPMLKLGYHKLLSETKLGILSGLARAGGKVNSLESLSDLTGIEKSLLSKHINGSVDSQGLIELGLVEVNRYSRGRLQIEITALGNIVLM